MITHRIFSPEDKEDMKMIRSWWKDWRRVLPDDAFLPETGIMIEKDGVPVAAGFLYLTDSLLAWFEWIACDMKATKDDRNDGLNYLLDKAGDIALEMGRNCLFCSLINGNLKNRMIEHGFEITEDGMTNLIRRLQWQ